MFDVWACHAGEEYLMFVDESFRRFMTMTEVDSRYGYFSYGAVGVPSTEYDALKADVAPLGHGQPATRDAVHSRGCRSDRPIVRGPSQATTAERAQRPRQRVDGRDS